MKISTAKNHTDSTTEGRPTTETRERSHSQRATAAPTSTAHLLCGAQRAHKAAHKPRYASHSEHAHLRVPLHGEMTRDPDCDPPRMRHTAAPRHDAPPDVRSPLAAACPSPHPSQGAAGPRPCTAHTHTRAAHATPRARGRRGVAMRRRRGSANAAPPPSPLDTPDGRWRDSQHGRPRLRRRGVAATHLPASAAGLHRAAIIIVIAKVPP